jgi:hypothetical protein
MGCGFDAAFDDGCGMGLSEEEATSDGEVDGTLGAVVVALSFFDPSLAAAIGGVRSFSPGAIDAAPPLCSKSALANASRRSPSSSSDDSSSQAFVETSVRFLSLLLSFFNCAFVFGAGGWESGLSVFGAEDGGGRFEPGTADLREAWAT